MFAYDPGDDKFFRHEWKMWSSFVWKKLRSCKLMLDVGVGSGRLERFKPDNARVVGVDVFKTGATYAAKYLYDFVNGDALFLPFKDDVFDAVVLSHLVEHFENPEKSINECYRVLKEDGIVYIETPSKQFAYFFEDPTHKKPFSENELIGLVSTRFKILESGRLHYLTKKPPHYDLIHNLNLGSLYSFIIRTLFGMRHEAIYCIGMKT